MSVEEGLNIRNYCNEMYDVYTSFKDSYVHLRDGLCEGNIEVDLLLLGAHRLNV